MSPAQQPTSGVMAAAPVFKTGQTRCWDGNGRPIDCAHTGQDGDYQAGVSAPDPRFIDQDDGTILDELTGLIWLKNANAFGEVPWEQALQHANNLANGQARLTDGSAPGDWRLPNVNELQSLLDLSSTTGPAVPDGHPFTDLQVANYWTSTTVVSAPPLGWYVAMAVGPPVFDLKINAMRMWPVRSGGMSRVARTGQTGCWDAFGNPIDCAGSGQDGDIQAGVPFPSPRFVDHENGTVTDLLTGLIWLKNANPFGSLSWEQALIHYNDLASGHAGLTDGSKAGDWRLPNINELRSLISYDSQAPALPTGHPFTDVRSSLYWSSTTVASAPNQARFVFVGLSSAVWDHKSVQIGSWPVRGGI